MPPLSHFSHFNLDTQVLAFLRIMSTLVTSFLLLLVMLVNNQASPLPGQDDDDTYEYQDPPTWSPGDFYLESEDQDEFETRRKREVGDPFPLKTKKKEDFPGFHSGLTLDELMQNFKEEQLQSAGGKREVKGSYEDPIGPCEHLSSEAYWDCED